VPPNPAACVAHALKLSRWAATSALKKSRCKHHADPHTARYPADSSTNALTPPARARMHSDRNWCAL